MKNFIIAALLVSALFSLTACGVKGNLELPETEKENMLYR